MFEAIMWAGGWAVARNAKDGARTVTEAGLTRKEARTLAWRLNSRKVSYAKRSI